MADTIRIVWVNIIVYLIVTVLDISDVFVLSSDILSDIRHPWVLITYMFTQVNIVHLCVNMLWLYLFGTYLSNLKLKNQIWYIYISGGITAGLIYLVCNIALDKQDMSNLIGASGSVMAVVLSTAVLVPNAKINLLMGKIKLKWFGVLTVILFTLGLSGSNYCSHIAHIGGAIAGLLYGCFLKRIHFTDCNADQEKLIEKIKISGFSSLSENEKTNLSG